MTGINTTVLDMDRFTKPDGLTTHRFNMADDRVLRYANIIPEGADKTIIIVPGNQEALEKYYETIRDINAAYPRARIFIYDPFGQGHSGRYLTDTTKMHSIGFERDVADLTAFMDRVVTPTHIRGQPIIIAAHSKGAHITMRYLTYTDDPITKAILVAPMMNINTGLMPRFMARYMAGAFHHMGVGAMAIPLTPPYNPNWTINIATDILTSDPTRGMVRHLWGIKDPVQCMKSITTGWLYHAFQSIRYLNNETVLRRIRQRCTIITPGGDKLVDIPAQLRAARILPNCAHHIIDDARHDVWMERDSYREHFVQLLLNDLRA